ncbi:MAG: TonB-dependent receptor [bacterium]
MLSLLIALFAVVPPSLVVHEPPIYPDALRAAGRFEGAATVVLHVDAAGLITQIDLIEADDPAYFAALCGVVHAWQFKPAQVDGVDAEAEVRLTWNFKTEPPPPPPPAAGRLEGRLVRRGIRGPLPGLVVRLQPGETEAISDRDGRFAVELSPGTYQVEIDDARVQPFRGEVQVEAGKLVAVRWDLTPIVGVGADLVVVGKRVEESVQRTTLDTFELTHVAGTMGDPLRVLQSLPGVGTVASLLPYPVVRGAPPGDALYQLDGAPVPLLFHVGVGTSVVHPRLIDRVDFYPGVAPLRYGRAVGGVVDAVTRRPLQEGWLADLDVNLFQSGALVSAPLADDTRLTIGGRYSYTALLLSIFAPDVDVGFWDYQARLDHDLPDDARLQLVLFGARDTVEARSEDVTEDGRGRTRVVHSVSRTETGFHRVAARLTLPTGDADRLDLGVDLGLDGSLVEDVDDDPTSDDSKNRLDELLVRPKATWHHPIEAGLDLRLGADLEVRRSTDSLSDDADDETIRSFLGSGTRVAGGVFGALDWQASSDLLLSPGVRADGFWRDAARYGIDPRINARYALGPDTTLKGQAGLSHAPQRFFVPVPGLGEIEIDTDLIEAWQVAVGIEHRFAEHWSLDATVYGVWLENLLSLKEQDEEDETTVDATATADDFTFATEGRGGGLEVMLRRHRAGTWFGWLAVTLQRHERRDEGGDWLASAIDQALLLNLVLTWQMADLWTVGARAHYHTGRPEREGVEDRLPGFFQLDLRVDRTWIHDAWQIDFYLDVINATYSREVLSVDEDGSSDGLQYILPTLGVHAVF